MSDDPLPLSRIIKSIKKKYDEDEEKENWKVRGGNDQYGNRDMIISRDPDTWYIKSKMIDPTRSISFGRELNIRSLDDDIAQEMGKKSFDPKEALHSLFGMAVPTEEKEVITAAGIQKIEPMEVNFTKQRIDEKYPNTRKDLEKQVQNTWRKHFPDRDNVYI